MTPVLLFPVCILLAIVSNQIASRTEFGPLYIFFARLLCKTVLERIGPAGWYEAEGEAWLSYLCWLVYPIVVIGIIDSAIQYTERKKE